MITRTGHFYDRTPGESNAHGAGEHKQIAHHFAKQGKMNILNAIPIITQKDSQHHIRAVTGLKEN